MRAMVTVISLGAAGVVSRRQAEVRDKYVIEKPGGLVYLLHRARVIVRGKPIAFETVEALCEAPTPTAPLEPRLEKQIVVGDNAPVAIAWEEDSPENIKKEAMVLNQSTRLEAAFNQASKEAREEQLTRAFFFLSITVGGVSMVVAVITVLQFFT